MTEKAALWLDTTHCHLCPACKWAGDKKADFSVHASQQAHRDALFGKARSVRECAALKHARSKAVATIQAMSRSALSEDLVQALQNVRCSIQCLCREDAETIASMRVDLDSSDAVAEAAMRVIMLSNCAQTLALSKQNALFNLQVAFGSSSQESRQKIIDVAFRVVEGTPEVARADMGADQNFLLRAIDVYGDLPLDMQTVLCEAGANMHLSMEKCLQVSKNARCISDLWQAREPQRITQEWEHLKATFTSLPTKCKWAVLAAAKGHSCQRGDTSTAQDNTPAAFDASSAAGAAQTRRKVPRLDSSTPPVRRPSFETVPQQQDDDEPVAKALAKKIASPAGPSTATPAFTHRRSLRGKTKLARKASQSTHAASKKTGDGASTAETR